MLKVLIIDDTKSVHLYVKTLLSKAQGIEVVDAYNGQEGLHTLMRESDFDLILLDWEMPVMNGIETLEQLLHFKDRPPTIMMTTKNEPKDIATALGLGAADYMMKPFTIDIMFEKIELVTGKRIAYAA